MTSLKYDVFKIWHLLNLTSLEYDIYRIWCFWNNNNDITLIVVDIKGHKHIKSYQNSVKISSERSRFKYDIFRIGHLWNIKNNKLGIWQLKNSVFRIWNLQNIMSSEYDIFETYTVGCI